MSLVAAVLPVCLFCGQRIRLWKRGCGRIRRIKRRGERCFQAYRRKFWDWWRDGDFFSLSELAFRNDGSIEAYYDDGDIFWGHCIIVRMDKNGNIEDAEIAG